MIEGDSVIGESANGQEAATATRICNSANGLVTINAAVGLGIIDRLPAAGRYLGVALDPHGLFIS